MKTITKQSALKSHPPVLKLALTCVTAGWMYWVAGSVCHAQSQPANLSPDLQQVVKLSQSRMGDGVIISYIKNTGKSYQLGADDIIYLSSQGVSQGVIGALQATASPSPVPLAPWPLTPPPTGPAPQPPEAQAPPPPPLPDPQIQGVPPTPLPDSQVQAPAAPAVSLDSFQNQLAPYGNWLQTPDGPVWQPNVPAGWRPYYDGGHWVMTDAGWYWQSDYTWGDIAFHYGRWSYSNDSGWVWTPGYDFAPAWVCWRHADDDGYCGWAPLPPGALFVDGGWRYHDAVVAADFDFGLTVGFFTFVDYGHFWEHDYRRFIVPRDRLRSIWGRSVFANHYRFDHGRFFNDGLDRERMAHFTGREIRVENSRDLRQREVHDHVAQRAHDRETVRSGGRLESGGRMSNNGPRNEAGHASGIERSSNTERSGMTARSSSGGGALAMPGHNGGGSTGGGTTDSGRSSSEGALGMPKSGESGGASRNSQGSSGLSGHAQSPAPAVSHTTTAAKPAASSGSQKKKP